VVNGTATALAIANNIFSLLRSRGNEESDVTFEDRPSVELIGNRLAGAHGSCPQLTCLNGISDYG
jgi:hypothetical protein